MDEDGRSVHPGDMAKQTGQALDNLEAVPTAAGYWLSELVRLTIDTTIVPDFLSHYEGFSRRVAAVGCRYSSTLIGVSSQAFPELLVELEATAVEA